MLCFKEKEKKDYPKTPAYYQAIQVNYGREPQFLIFQNDLFTGTPQIVQIAECNHIHIENIESDCKDWDWKDFIEEVYQCDSYSVKIVEYYQEFDINIIKTE